MEIFKRRKMGFFTLISLFLFFLLLVSPVWAEEYDQAKLFKSFNSESFEQDEQEENVQEENAQKEISIFSYYQSKPSNYWYGKMPNWMPWWIKKPVAQVIYICDQAANTVLEVVALAGQSLAKSPILVYGLGSGDMLINFVDSLLFNNAEVKVMETEPDTIPDEFIARVEEETGIETVREEPVDEYVYNFCLEKDNYPEVVVVADQEEFMPYGSLYASRNDGVFVNTVEEAERIVQNDQDVEEIVYFGDNPETAEKLKELTPQQENFSFPYFSAWSKQRSIFFTPQETFTQVSSIDEAEQLLIPTTKLGIGYGVSTSNAVTVISSDDSQYRGIAPIYAYLRDTALISVETKDKTVEEVDAAIDSKLDQNILPYNYGRDPDYLIISEPWEVIPYRYNKDDYMGGRYIAADTIYADRDGDFVQDMAVGRFTAYDKPGAAMLMNRGYFFEQGEMERGDKALILQPWEKNFSMWIGDEYFESDFYSRLGVQPIQNDLIAMYGEGNVYGKVGYETTGESTEPDESWPSLGESITLLGESEMNYVAGHANPYTIATTGPYLTGAKIRDSGHYPPSLWYFYGCSTGVTHQDYMAKHPEAQGKVGEADTLIHGAITGGAVNMVVSADNVPYGNYTDWPEWTTKYLSQGETIGKAIMKGQKLAGQNVDQVGIYNWLKEEGMNPTCKQTYLIGDPMVKYGSKSNSVFSHSEGNIDRMELSKVTSDDLSDSEAKVKITPAIEDKLMKTFGKAFGTEVTTGTKTSAFTKPHPVEFKEKTKEKQLSKATFLAKPAEESTPLKSKVFSRKSRINVQTVLSKNSSSQDRQGQATPLFSNFKVQGQRSSSLFSNYGTTYQAR